MQNGSATLEDSLVISYETKGTLWDPGIMLFGICPKELKIYAHTKTSTQMFTVAL